MWIVTTALRSLMQNSVEDHPRLLMNQIFWARMHGGATHFPIASLMVSVVFDVFGFYSLLIAAAASPFAVLSGIAMSKGKLMGSGDLLLHHLFIWPAFGLLVGLAAWRLVMRGNASRRASGCYLVLVMITAAAMMGAGYWGGEMLIGK